MVDVAALMAGTIAVPGGTRVMCVITGGNLDPEQVAAVV